MTKDSWWKDIIGKKVSVSFDPAVLGGASASTPAPVPSGRPGAAPYAVAVDRYEGFGSSESAWIEPAEAPPMVRAAYAMMSLIAEESAFRRGLGIRHTVRCMDKGKLMGTWMQTWMVRVNYTPEWRTLPGGSVAMQWVWRVNEWTRVALSEMERDRHGHYNEKEWWSDMMRVAPVGSSDAAVHLEMIPGMIDMLCDLETGRGLSGVV